MTGPTTASPSWSSTKPSLPSSSRKFGRSEGTSLAKPWMCEACSCPGSSPVITRSTVTLVSARFSVTSAAPNAPELFEGASSAA